MPNGSKRTARQEEAVLALLETPTIAAAAHKIGVNESTLRRWRAEPEFQQALDETRREAYSEALHRMRASADKAVDALLKVLEDDDSKPSEQISAARVVLSHAHRAEDALNVRQRLAALEAALEARMENLQ